MKTVPKSQPVLLCDSVRRELDKAQLREELLSLASRLNELRKLWPLVPEQRVLAWGVQQQGAYWRAQSTISRLTTAFQQLLAAYRQLLPSPPEPRVLEIAYDLGECDKNDKTVCRLAVPNEIGYIETLPYHRR